MGGKGNPEGSPHVPVFCPRMLPDRRGSDRALIRRTVILAGPDRAPGLLEQINGSLFFTKSTDDLPFLVRETHVGSPERTGSCATTDTRPGLTSRLRHR
jgi:hypothetical protein